MVSLRWQGTNQQPAKFQQYCNPSRANKPLSCRQLWPSEPLPSLQSQLQGFCSMVKLQDHGGHRMNQHLLTLTVCMSRSCNGLAICVYAHAGLLIERLGRTVWLEKLNKNCKLKPQAPFLVPNPMPQAWLLLRLLYDVWNSERHRQKTAKGQALAAPARLVVHIWHAEVCQYLPYTAG